MSPGAVAAMLKVPREWVVEAYRSGCDTIRKIKVYCEEKAIRVAKVSVVEERDGSIP